MTLLSEIYDVTLKRGIRGKASEGFVRPTVGECFMTHRDFKEVMYIPEVGEQFGGGYYCGSYGGYHIICSSQAGGQQTSRVWTASKLFCTDLTLNGYDDWYLPSWAELSIIYGNRATLSTNGCTFLDRWYWSATEATDTDRALCKDFENGSNGSFTKFEALTARAVRKIAI